MIRCKNDIVTAALEQFLHRYLLGQGAGVLAATVLVQTALIADADAVGIETLGVSSHLTLRTTRIERAILRDVVMITYSLETSCLMTRFQLLYREVLIHSRCTAMKYNQRNISLVFTHNFI